MSLTGSASLEMAHHGGARLRLSVAWERSPNFSVPPSVRSGTWTVEVIIYCEGEAIDAGAFRLEMLG